MPNQTLGPKGIAAVERRGISAETAVHYGLFTGRGERPKAVTPDIDGNVVAFPYVEHGRVVAEKYRGPGKVFWQRSGGKKTFWNSDVLDDPVLEAVNGPGLIITEGEIDALTALDCGFPFTVSVPDGAPPVPAGREPEDLDPANPDNEHDGKFAYVHNNRDRLRRVRRFVLAVDADGPGRRLGAELVRRFGPGRCLFVTYPEGCKDLNDVLTRHGRDAVTRVLNEAKPYPVKGLYQLHDFPKANPFATYSTGFETLDRHLRLFEGDMVVVTGIPGHGKSTLVTQLLVNLSEIYGWRHAVCSPEMPIMTQYRDKMRAVRLGRQPLDDVDRQTADAFIDENFLFIDSVSVDDIAEEATLEWVLERATDAVQRDGIRTLTIDPWNELEHARLPHETQVEYIGRALRTIRRWQRQTGVLVFLVAHPTKDVGHHGESRMPTPYDIDGAAHWFNKPDHVLIVHRPDEAVNETVVRIAKVRFDGTGEKGMVTFLFDRPSGRFRHLDDPRKGPLDGELRF